MKNTIKLELAFIVVNIFLWPRVCCARLSKAEREENRSDFWKTLASLNMLSSCLSENSPKIECGPIFNLAAFDKFIKISGTIPLTSSGANFSTLIQEIRFEMSQNERLNTIARVRELEILLVQKFARSSAPISIPSLDHGRTLFKDHCESCHGDGMGGLGKLTSKLTRMPSAFTSAKARVSQFPFGTYSKVLTGIPNSEMSAFSDVLSYEEIWAVSFYVQAIPYMKNSKIYTFPEGIFDPDYALLDLALLTDVELTDKLKMKGLRCGSCEDELRYLRTDASFLNKVQRRNNTDENVIEKTDKIKISAILLGVFSITVIFILALRRHR